MRLPRTYLPALFALALLGSVLALSRAGATGTNSIEAPDGPNDVGLFTSLVLDAAGNPVVSYRDETDRRLKILHCNDPDCRGGDESIATPDTFGDTGWSTSLVLDASGNPVVSYGESTLGDLRILRCGNPTCTAGNSAVAADTMGDVGAYTSLALDADGNPVVSYYDRTNFDLKVLHCGNPNCTSGNSITSPDTAGDVGQYPSLALDAAGYPVVAYYDFLNGDLKVLHCNDADCSDGGESITSPDTDLVVGVHPSLALDASDNPAVSYYDATVGSLKLLRCGDPQCAAVATISAPDGEGDVGAFSSLALDDDGLAIISYWDATNRNLKVLRCPNPGCFLDAAASVPAADEAGDVGRYTSLVLDAAGNPVVSYEDRTNSDLKILHCGDTGCTGEKPGPGLVGDVDCNGTRNAVDAALILQLSAGLVASLPCEENGDVSGSGAVDSIDAALILQAVAGLLFLPAGGG